MIIGIFALVMGCAAFYISYKAISTNSEVKKWSKIKTTITHNEVKENPTPRRAWINYNLFVDYTYSINNKEYKSSLIYFEELFALKTEFSKNDAEALSKQINTEIEVFVNPNKPEQAVLSLRNTALYYFVLAMGVFSFFMGLYYLLKK